MSFRQGRSRVSLARLAVEWATARKHLCLDGFFGTWHFSGCYWVSVCSYREIQYFAWAQRMPTNVPNSYTIYPTINMTMTTATDLVKASKMINWKLFTSQYNTAGKNSFAEIFCCALAWKALPSRPHSVFYWERMNANKFLVVIQMTCRKSGIALLLQLEINLCTTSIYPIHGFAFALFFPASPFFAYFGMFNEYLLALSYRNNLGR